MLFFRLCGHSARSAGRAPTDQAAAGSNGLGRRSCPWLEPPTPCALIGFICDNSLPNATAKNVSGVEIVLNIIDLHKEYDFLHSFYLHQDQKP